MKTLRTPADAAGIKFGESFVIDSGIPEPDENGQFDMDALDAALKKRDAIQDAVDAALAAPPADPRLTMTAEEMEEAYTVAENKAYAKSLGLTPRGKEIDVANQIFAELKSRQSLKGTNP